MLKNLVFYTVVGTIVALIAQAVGLSWGVTLLLSLLVPPIILLVIAILRYRNLL
jgi:hypothetical protein